jgi:hypothetical protein
MSDRSSLFSRFGQECVPTLGQVLLVIASSAALIVMGRSASILRAFGITPAGADAAAQSFRQQFELVLNSAVTENIILILFWAAIGMIVYLVCWSLYGAYVAARNEVDLKIDYVNLGRWQGPWVTLGVKFLGAIVLIALLALFVPGNTLWELMSVPFFEGPNLSNTAAFAEAIIGLALQLYLILVGVQLTFTPWYNEKAFTD